jgi:hypothetical protein
LMFSLFVVDCLGTLNLCILGTLGFMTTCCLLATKWCLIWPYKRYNLNLAPPLIRPWYRKVCYIRVEPNSMGLWYMVRYD